MAKAKVRGYMLIVLIVAGALLPNRWPQNKIWHPSGIGPE